MNFGDILNSWDDQQTVIKNKPQNNSGVSHKKANAPDKNERAAAARKMQTFDEMMKKQAATKINPMELWLRRYGTIDKDAEAEKFNEQRKLSNRTYLKQLQPEAVLDLHGMTGEEALARMDSFVAECKAQGMVKIMFVHGKGIHSNGSDPVLGEAVRSFIENDKRLGVSGHPDRHHGGSGATWVIVREKNK